MLFGEERKVSQQAWQAWNVLRSTLQNFTFNTIKDIVGLAGFNLLEIAHLDQSSGFKTASKGQLMTTIDRGLKYFYEESLKRFITVVAEEMLKVPDTRQTLQDNLLTIGMDA